MTRHERVLELRVVGVPVTQGSKRAVLRGKRAGMIDANDAKLRPWREAIRYTTVVHLGTDWTPITGPVSVVLNFALPKPASAPKSRRTWPTGARSGDVDKLARAVLDALTDAGLYGDDSQVVQLVSNKDYPDEYQTAPGVLIVASRIEATEGEELS